MDLNSPDSDIPGVYRRSSVPFTVNPADSNAVQQAILSSLMQRYPINGMGLNLGASDPDTLRNALLNILLKPSQMQPQQAAPAGIASGLQ